MEIGIMTVVEFKVWLIENGYTQKRLATELEITEPTLSRYVKTGKFPKVFQLALKALDTRI